MNSCNVIEEVVDQGLCIGCGLCVSACGGKNLEMGLNKHGFLEPRPTAEAGSSCDNSCLAVCPFNPKPKDDVRNEDELANHFLSQTVKHNNYIGKYINTYAGYSFEHRMTSSSGGVATYTLIELLTRGEINNVVSVKDSKDGKSHYEYAISNTEEELRAGAKTKYFPVTLAEVFDKIKELNGNVALVGIPCFVKAVRLSQKIDPILNKKITFIVGIICGGVKSTFFTEYLASKAGVPVSDFSDPQFRIKDPNSTASDYSFGCLDKNKKQQTIKMRMVGDMWGTGLFKSNACDFCDDVSVELADISLGDAWISPYSSEGEGTNVIVTRSKLAENIIQEGISSKSLYVESLSPERFIESQKGGYNHRHAGLGFRIKKRQKQGLKVPPKRFEKDELTFLLKLIHTMRMRVRSKSLEVWLKTKNAEEFDKQMKKSLQLLKFLTTTNHRIVRFKKRGELMKTVKTKLLKNKS